MSTPQEYWDACLIKVWRNIGTFTDARVMFHSITKTWPDECEPPLLRYPTQYIPRGMQVKYFVAHYLPKMSDWLWSHTPDKDVELLRAISKSKYTVTKERLKSDDERERKNIYRKGVKDRALREFRTTMISRANEDSDGNVVKPAGKYRTGKRK